MWVEMLRDPAVRRAYVLAKVAVFAIAAVATWPLAQMIGPRAWWGLAIFGGALAAITIAVLAAAGRADGPRSSPRTGEPDDDPESDHEPIPETVEVPIEDAIDLHPYPPKDVPDVVDAYLEAAVERGFDEVRLIHGRGIGVQRERVRSLLAKHPLVVRFGDAPPARGGWGATLAVLRRPDQDSP